MKTLALIIFFYAPLSFAMDDDVIQDLLALTGDLTAVRANLIHVQGMFVFRKNVRALENELKGALVTLEAIKADLDAIVPRVTEDHEQRQVLIIYRWYKETKKMCKGTTKAVGINLAPLPSP